MKTKSKAVKVAAVAAAMVVVGSGAALAKDVSGTPRGEVLHGTDRADTIHGFGGADLIYGYGGDDHVYGGNETVSGDEVLGGAGMDGLIGQKGHDALYGGLGKDRLDGQRGRDSLVGGPGEDVLNGGFGADKVNARDGQRDFIELCGSRPSDVVYHDPGVDVFIKECPATAEKDAGVSAAEAIESGEVKLVAEDPPEGLFDRTGKALVEHSGEERLVSEKELAEHMRHGDEILDPTGRATAGR